MTENEFNGLLGQIETLVGTQDLTVHGAEECAAELRQTVFFLHAIADALERLADTMAPKPKDN